MCVNEIIDGVIKSPDLGNLKTLKRNGLLKEQIKAVLQLGESVPGLPDIVGLIEKEIEIAKNYKLAEFVRKFVVFVMELTDLSAEERVRFSKEIQEKGKDFSGNIIMGMIDRLDNIHKEEILASLTKARIHGFISIENFFRLSSMLERIPFTDLELLQNYSKPYYDESGDTELLFATGALNLETIDANNGNMYVLSKLGEELMRWGVQEPIEVANRSNGTRFPVASEEVAGSIVDELT